MATAQATMLSTPELLEHTLAHLPMRHLLVVAPLVSRMWQAITLSPTLQRALFFEPDSSATEPIQNPMLVELFPPFFSPAGKVPWSWPGNAYEIKHMPWAKAPSAFKRANASWRRMLVTQPPTQTLVVTHTSHTMSGNYEHRAEMKDLSLRMGMLYDLVLPFADEDAYFCILWRNAFDGEGDKGDSTFDTQGDKNDVTLAVYKDDGKDDVTLALWNSVSCMGSQGGRCLDERFDCEGRKEVKLNWGETVNRGFWN
ncbi:hypothetical protein K438DRAFT_2014700 [Mycena galopus ATCC 62051]|nr:hypothetical protein K438DRAFT_2014700 [Mycena galopus ATCC 62051]